MDVFLLCDHKRCHKCFDQCNHTSDLNHTAWNGEKTFELIGGRAYFEQADNCRQSGEAEGDREDHLLAKRCTLCSRLSDSSDQGIPL